MSSESTANAGEARLRVGIPRSLMYHVDPVMIETFVNGVGATPVLSPPTTRRIMERGVSLSVDEACLPLKVHLGHVDALRDKTDCVLVPRIASTSGVSEDTCVRFWATYDITANTMPDVELVGYDVDAKLGKRERDEMVDLGVRLGASKREARRAYEHARKQASDARAKEIDAQAEGMLADDDRARVLVVGHRYVLDDKLLGEPILRLIEREDVAIIRSDRVADETCLARYHEISPRLKWRYNQEQLGAIASLRDEVDGIVMLVTFPCGPDSLCAELCQRVIDDTPLATIVLDEHSGAGGLQTRIESFCDIVKMRRAS